MWIAGGWVYLSRRERGLIDLLHVGHITVYVEHTKCAVFGLASHGLRATGIRGRRRAHFSRTNLSNLRSSAVNVSYSCPFASIRGLN